MQGNILSVIRSPRKTSYPERSEPSSQDNTSSHFSDYIVNYGKHTSYSGLGEELPEGVRPRIY